MITEDQINRIVEIIVENVKPEKIVLFGSYAYGEPHEDSDLDLLIVKDTAEDGNKRTRGIRKYLRGIKIPVDLVVYTSAEINEWKDTDSAFVTRIVKKGRILYE